MTEKLILPEGYQDLRNRKLCWACHEVIHLEQKYCSTCNHWQNWRKHSNFFSGTILSLLVALAGLSIPIIDRIDKFYSPFETVAWVRQSNQSSIDVSVLNQSSIPAHFPGTGRCSIPIKRYLEDDIYLVAIWHFYSHQPNSDVKIEGLKTYKLEIVENSYTFVIVDGEENLEYNFYFSDITEDLVQKFLSPNVTFDAPKHTRCKIDILYKGERYEIDAAINDPLELIAVFEEKWRTPRTNQTTLQPPANSPTLPEDLAPPLLPPLEYIRPSNPD
ncbi:hypothetical protein JF549_08995 [Labrenzia aggregata]|nr:hypothetical protein [Roseibium aggregatum]